MRYSVSEIRDQIIATLVADTTNFSTVRVDTYAGQVNAQRFSNPEYMQGFVQLLPFCYVSYQGRVGEKANRDSSGKTYIHTLTFRIFTGAKSERNTKEASNNCYDMLAACFDDLHGKVPYMTSQLLPGYTPMSGTAISTSEFNPLSPLYETGGQDEQLVVSLPGIVVYQSDFSIRLLA